MRHSEQLEEDVEQTREQLARSLDELRYQVSPDHLIDDFLVYTREGPVADFLGNLAKEVQENPLPVLLIVAGIAWLIASSSLKQLACKTSAEHRPTGQPDPRLTGSAVVEREGWAVVPAK